MANTEVPHSELTSRVFDKISTSLHHILTTGEFPENGITREDIVYFNQVIEEERSSLEEKLRPFAKDLMEHLVNTQAPGEESNIVEREVPIEGSLLHSFVYAGDHPDVNTSEMWFRVKGSIYEAMARHFQRGTPVLDLAGITVFTKDNTTYDEGWKQRLKEKGIAYKVQKLIEHSGLVSAYNHTRFYNCGIYQGAGTHQQVFHEKLGRCYLNTVKLNNPHVLAERIENLSGKREQQGDIEGVDLSYFYKDPFGLARQCFMALKGDTLVDIGVRTGRGNKDTLEELAHELTPIILDKAEQYWQEKQEIVGTDENSWTLKYALHCTHWFYPDIIIPWEENDEGKVTVYRYATERDALQHIAFHKSPTSGFVDKEEMDGVDQAKMVWQRGDKALYVARQGKKVIECLAGEGSPADVRLPYNAFNVMPDLHDVERIRPETDDTQAHVIHDTRNIRLLARYKDILSLCSEMDSKFQVMDRYKEPKCHPNGDTYKDLQFNATTPEGHVVEFQVKDILTHFENELGEANHTDYKKRQIAHLKESPGLKRFLEEFNNSKGNPFGSSFFQYSFHNKNIETLKERILHVDSDHSFENVLEEMRNEYTRIEETSEPPQLEDIVNKIVDIPSEFAEVHVERNSERYIPFLLELNQRLGDDGFPVPEENDLLYEALARETKTLARKAVEVLDIDELHSIYLERLTNLETHLSAYMEELPEEKRDTLVEELQSPISEYVHTMSRRIRYLQPAKARDLVVEQDSQYHKVFGEFERLAEQVGIRYSPSYDKDTISKEFREHMLSTIRHLVMRSASKSGEEKNCYNLVAMSLFKDLVIEEQNRDPLRSGQRSNLWTFMNEYLRFDADLLEYVPPGMSKESLAKRPDTARLESVCEREVGDQNYAAKAMELYESIS